MKHNVGLWVNGFCQVVSGFMLYFWCPGQNDCCVHGELETLYK